VSELRTVLVPLDEVAATLRAKDAVAHGAEGRAFEAVFMKALRLLGLQFEEAAGATSAVWDIRPSGPGWSPLLADTNVNLKIKGTRWLFTARAVYDAMKAGAKNVRDGTWSPSRASAHVEKAVRDAFKAKGVLGTAFMKPKDAATQKAIDAAVRKKDKAALRALLSGKNFSIKKLGRSFDVKVDVDWTGFDCEADPACARSADKREGSWQRTAKIIVNGGVRAAPFNIRTEVKWNLDPRRAAADGGPVTYPNIIFRDSNPDETKPWQAAILASVEEALIEASGNEPRLTHSMFSWGAVMNGLDDAEGEMSDAVQTFGDGRRWKDTPPKWASAVSDAIKSISALDDWMSSIAWIGRDIQKLNYYADKENLGPENGFDTTAGDKAIAALEQALDLWKKVRDEVRAGFVKAKDIYLKDEPAAAFSVDVTKNPGQYSDATKEVATLMRKHGGEWSDFARIINPTYDPVSEVLIGAIMPLKTRREQDTAKGRTDWVQDAVYHYASALHPDWESGWHDIEHKVRELVASLASVVFVLPRLAHAMKKAPADKLRAALLTGKEVLQKDVPTPRKDRNAYEVYDLGRSALALAKAMNLKPTPANQLAPSTRQVLKSLKELVAEMEDADAEWKKYREASGAASEETSRQYRAAVDAELKATGKYYSDIRVKYPNYTPEVVEKLSTLLNTAMLKIMHLYPKLGNRTEALRDLPITADYGSPMYRLLTAVQWVGKACAGQALRWRDMLRPPQLEMSMLLGANKPETQEMLHLAYVKASNAMDNLYRGATHEDTSWPRLLDALKIATQIIPLLHTAGAERAEANPPDWQTDIGKVGPWDLKLFVPGGARATEYKDNPNKLPWGAQNYGDGSLVKNIKKVAEFALKAFRRVGVKDRALAGPIIVKWRDPSSEEDQGSRGQRAGGWYSHSDGSIVVYFDMIDVDAPDVGPADATWIFIHEVAHRVYYKGLTTNARNYWHTLIQKLGDPMSVTMKKLVFSIAAEDGGRLFDGQPLDASTTEVGVNEWGGMFKPKAVIASANANDRHFAETIWWWYKDRWPHAKLDAWLNAKRYTKELPTEYANITPTEAWPEAVANTLLKRPRAKEGRDTTPFVRAVIHRLLGQVRENVEEATATAVRKPPVRRRKKKVPKPALDRILNSQSIEQVAQVGPVRVSVVMRDEPMLTYDRSMKPSKQNAVRAAIRAAGAEVAYSDDIIGDVIDKVKRAVAIMRKGGIPDRALAARVVFDFTRRIDAYADADYTYSMDVVVAKVGVDVPTIIHELAHRIWFKALGERGRKAWLAFVDSIGEPLPEKLQAVAFALALREEWEILEEQSEDEDDFREMWVATMTRLEHFMNNRPHLYAGMPIEEYEPQKVIDRAPQAMFNKAGTLWLAFKAQHSTSPREFGEWLEAKKYATKLPSAYANTDEAEAWAEAVMDTLFAKWNGLDPATHAQVREQVMRLLHHIREDVNEEDEEPVTKLMPLSALTEARQSLIECLRSAGLDEAAFSETSTAVTLRVPSSIARQFPDKGDTDPTPAHVTILVVGDAPTEKWKRVQEVVRDLAAETRPFQASLGDYGEFKPKPDFIVSHMQVESSGLRAFYQRLLVALREGGVSFELKFPQFKPHVTLSYGAEPWKGRRPSGSWTVDEVEVWRGTKQKVKIPLGVPAKVVAESLDEAEDARIGAGASALYTNPSGEKFWGSQGAGVLPVARSTGRVLVSYRSSRVNEPHTWGVFGGAIDAGEDPKRAAMREMQEELGCCRDVDLIPGFVFTSSGGGFKYYNFLGLVDEEFKPRLDWETEKAVWMSWSELVALRPKHFGLEAFMKNSKPLLQRHITESMLESTIIERSFTEKDIPEYFFLLTHPKRVKLADLESGVLKGVTGIAGDGRIMASINMGEAGFVITMPGAATVKLNKLSRVMYENPEYWVQDDFKAAKRVLNSHDAKSAGGKILRNAHEKARKRGLFPDTLGVREVPFEFDSWGDAPVRNLAAWARRLAQNAKNVAAARRKADPQYGWPYADKMAALTEKDWMEFIKLGTAKLADRFVIEGEWLVKDGQLRLPPGTDIRVMIPDHPREAAEVEEVLAKIPAKYPVQRFSQQEWGETLKAIRDEEAARWSKVYNEGVTEAQMCDMPIYGGLPSSGDFSSATEYEIGAQRAAWQRYLRVFKGKPGPEHLSMGQKEIPEEERVYPFDHPLAFEPWASQLRERAFLLDRLRSLGITKKYRVVFVKRADFKAAQRAWWAARDRAKQEDPTPAYHPPEGAVVENASADVADVFAVLKHAFDDGVWDGLPWDDLRKRTRLPKDRLRGALDTLVSRGKAVRNKGPDGVVRARVRPGASEEEGPRATLADAAPRVVTVPLASLT
jgi:2'-5' RNA ligase/8-oxo-dGTP pyrophosphatase MutT (NUDIX family)